MKRGFFISFEGIEGAGKTTQVNFLHDYLKNLEFMVLLTREPGGTELGKQLRGMLLNTDVNPPAMQTELLLYIADRAEHTTKVIIPALEDKKVVISDRYFDSTTAYQGYGRGYDLDLLRRMNEFAACGLKPDLTLLLDLPVEAGFTRLSRRNLDLGQKADRMETEETEFHERVRRGFLTIAWEDPQRVKILNALSPEEVLAKEIKTSVQELMGIN